MNSKDIYEGLIKPLPKEAIERAPKERTRKGYDTTGYQYQFEVERLNEVLGIDGWGWDYKIIKEIEGKWASGKGFWEITVDMKIELFLGDNKTISRTCAGGHKSEEYSDALKGAITNSFKKTVALFGLGQEAYKGMIDDDYLPPDSGNGRGKPDTKIPKAKQPETVPESQPESVVPEGRKMAFQTLKENIEIYAKLVNKTPIEVSNELKMKYKMNLKDLSAGIMWQEVDELKKKIGEIK